MDNKNNFKHLIHYRSTYYQPGDFNKPQKKLFSNHNSSGNLLVPQEPRTIDIIGRRLRSSYKYKRTNQDNGNWNNFLSKTSNERELHGEKQRQCNPKVLSSSLFCRVPTNNTNIRHNRSTIYSNHSFTTQIYSLPGGKKRNENLINDDIVRSKRTCIASLLKNNRDFGPMYVEELKENNSTSNNIFSGGYGNKSKNESKIPFGNIYRKINAPTMIKQNFRAENKIENRAFGRSSREINKQNSCFIEKNNSFRRDFHRNNKIFE